MPDSATKGTFMDRMNADVWKERSSWAHFNKGIFDVDL